MSKTKKVVPKHKVFVYGTLRPRDSGYNYISATHVLYGYQMFDNGSYPFIKPVGEATNSCILGNIIEANKKELEELDRYENIRSGLYVRNTATALSITDDEPVDVFVYAAGPLFDPQPIASGDWKQFTEERMSR
jgi:gamma-glutamylcyclotransferase (GGCT)/AIG2-like uncharacterized protein YtfP